MQNGMGAYFGSTKIIQGAAGLGDGPLQAFADGVVGGSAENPDMPGPLFAYHDGSLGDADGQLLAFADGVVGGAPPAYQMPGELLAYKDGSLGWYDQAAQGIGATDEEVDPTSSWHDGILGSRTVNIPGGTLMAYHDGSLGAYARAIGAAEQNVLDLGDANVLKELKTAMALIAPENTATMEAQKVYTPDWYTSGVWDPQASLLWQYIVSKTAAFKGKTVSADMGANSYPNATGIGFMVAALSAPQSGTYGPEWTKNNLPALYAWFTSGGGTVLPPYLSLADKTKGVRAATSEMKMSTVAMYGLGAVALLGVVLVMRKKRR